MSDDRSENWRRGHLDCVQDSCENCPFASVGGLEQRHHPIAPNYIPGGLAAEYLAGYEAAALELYGADWRTCTFSWQPALTIGEDPK